MTDIENMALKENKHLDLYLQENPEYYTDDGLVYYEDFKKQYNV